VHSEVELFKKYKAIVPKQQWEAFRSVISRKRNFQAKVFRSHNALHDGERWWTTTATIVRDLVGLSRGISLIEDADFRCILALDSLFNLDPQFILNYAGLKKPVEFGYMHTWREGPLEKRHIDRTGNWYKIDGSMDCYSSAQMDDLESPARQMEPKFWKRRNLSNHNRPWCQEACRQLDSVTIKSVYACYCLSDKLRKL
jgi:hypothetical protein